MEIFILKRNNQHIDENTSFHKACDELSCIDSDEKYLYFVLEDRYSDANKDNHRRIEFWGFDTANKVFFKLNNTKEKVQYFADVLRFPSRTPEIVQFQDQLVMSRIVHGKLSMCRTRLIRS